jgi:hypothetical protein
MGVVAQPPIASATAAARTVPNRVIAHPPSLPVGYRRGAGLAIVSDFGAVQRSGRFPRPRDPV